MKYYFDLQRFADEESEANETADASAQGTEETKPDGSTDKKYSDKDLDRIISKKFAEWSKKKDADVAKATMTAEQKAQAKQTQMEQQIADLMAEQHRTKMEKEAAKAFKAAGITDYEDLISFAIGKDAEETAGKASTLAAAMKAQRQAGAKQRNTGTTPAATSSAETKTDPLQRVINGWK